MCWLWPQKSGVFKSDAKEVLTRILQLLHAEQFLPFAFSQGLRVGNGYGFPLNIVSHSGVAAVSVTDETTITLFLCYPFVGLWTPDPLERDTNPHNVLTCWLLHLELWCSWQMCKIPSSQISPSWLRSPRRSRTHIIPAEVCLDSRLRTFTPHLLVSEAIPWIGMF